MLANLLVQAAALVAETTPVITQEMLNPVGEGMISAATVAIPVGISVMAVTAGIPIAKKVIKQLGR